MHMSADGDGNGNGNGLQVGTQASPRRWKELLLVANAGGGLRLKKSQTDEELDAAWDAWVVGAGEGGWEDTCAFVSGVENFHTWRGSGNVHDDQPITVYATTAPHVVLEMRETELDRLSDCMHQLSVVLCIKYLQRRFR